ncbi:MAG: single-stranded DNA-binding protein [Lentimicrobiaceae bacterium]|jgi:single-strand DNA-binding protein|nr:single-stranded DNA-binding protein [Lentimicrobiaceae bacterium]MDD4597962.1 single-stranded DNA-binding protein [Lentimicrobiaceae bacterium]MDY0025953.1 single-stranded DNA-binding protein [Lentimicrobium sp.]
MKALKNRVQLIGLLGADPEMKTFENGSVMAKLRLATHERAAGKNGEKALRTLWHDLIVWGKLAEICGKYLTKGREIAVEGRIGYRTYTDSEGKTRLVTEITVNDLLMISGRQAG